MSGSLSTSLTPGGPTSVPMARPPPSSMPGGLSPPSAAASRRAQRADVFRPISKLPLDPFAELDAAEPCTLDVTFLQALALSHEQRRAVILITGEPTTHDVMPLLQSASFSQSLVLIATTSPPPLPDLLPSHPWVRILRLASPDSTSALKLASLLERASEIAQVWRESPESEDRVSQFSEAGGVEGAEFNVVEEVIFTSSLPNHAVGPSTSDLSRLPSPAPSSHSEGGSSASSHKQQQQHSRSSTLATPPPTRPTSAFYSSRPSSIYSFLSSSSRSSLHSETSDASTKSTKSKKNTKKKKVKVRRGDSRVFDAVINFIPAASRSSDKGVLKGVVLLTTLGGGFLTGRPYGGQPSDIPGLASVRMRTTSNPTRVGLNIVGLPPIPPPKQSQLKKSTSSDVLTHGQQNESSNSSLPVTLNEKSKRRMSVRLGSFLGISSSKSTPSSPIAEETSSSHTTPPVPALRAQSTAKMAPRAHVLHIVPASFFPNPALSLSSYPPSTSRPHNAKPRTKPYFVQSIEQFLLSYSYPLQSSGTDVARNEFNYPRPGAAGAAVAESSQSRPLAFILPGSVFSASPAAYKQASIGEIILLGGLDPKPRATGKAWISSTADIKVIGMSPGSQLSVDPEPDAVTSYSRQFVKTKRDSASRRNSVDLDNSAPVLLSPETSTSPTSKKRHSTLPSARGRRKDSNENDAKMLPTPPESSGSSHDDDEDERLPRSQNPSHLDGNDSWSSTASSIPFSMAGSDSTVPAVARQSGRSSSRVVAKEIFSSGTTESDHTSEFAPSHSVGMTDKQSSSSGKKKHRLGFGSLRQRFFK
ncbi:hypothetical protein DL96DRAFT_1598193 [Flagelloscypha sp. PMI_526]|nr:hypothetical protein DL96DRAFT_1598193 [Flagelloscypha sp. PMI_526]